MSLSLPESMMLPAGKLTRVFSGEKTIARLAVLFKTNCRSLMLRKSHRFEVLSYCPSLDFAPLGAASPGGGRDGAQRVLLVLYWCPLATCSTDVGGWMCFSLVHRDGVPVRVSITSRHRNAHNQGSCMCLWTSTVQRADGSLQELCVSCNKTKKVNKPHPAYRGLNSSELLSHLPFPPVPCKQLALFLGAPSLPCIY